LPDPAARPLCVQLLPDTHDAGAENQCRYLLDGLSRSGAFDVELAYFGAGRAHSAFETIGVPTLQVPRLRRFRFDAYGRARRLRRAYASRPPDILQTWLLEGNVVGLLAARSWPGTRVVISQRGSWNERDYPALLRLQRTLWSRANHAISNSDGGAELLAGLGLPRERISVVPNGIPTDRVRVERDPIEVRREMGWDGQQVVAWVGRAEDAETAGQKDLGTLFAAMDVVRRTHPRVRLAMIGPTGSEIEDRGFRVPPWASTLGWQTRVVDLVNAADALILSSRTEGHSNVVGEALLLGVPVATTDCGGHCEAVRSGFGRIVEVGDTTALAAAVAALLDEPPARDAVRAGAMEALSVDRMVSSHVELYRELLDGPRLSSAGHVRDSRKGFAEQPG
jgi:glycosyltransferase involved in cell wall biosynthesis